MSYFFFKFQFHLKAERSHIHKQFMEKYETGNCGTAQNTDAQTVSNWYEMTSEATIIKFPLLLLPHSHQI